MSVLMPLREVARGARPARLSVATKSLSVCMLLLLVSLWGLGCRPTPQAPRAPEAGSPLRVMATVGMLADLVRQVGGPEVEVTALMGPGTDPHLYKPSPGDARRLLESHLILTCGHHLEGRMGETLEGIEGQIPVRAVCEMVESERWLRDPEQNAVDPHLWFDVALWARCAEIIGEILAEVDADQAAAYRARARTVHAELLALDGEVRERLATIPPQQRVLITAHDAFRYLERAYGIEVLGVQGLSTDAEAGMQRITELVRLIVERRVRAVFVESTVSDKNIQALVEGCRARGHTLTIGGTLFSDAMGDIGTPEGSYVGMVRHNVRTIVEALE